MDSLNDTSWDVVIAGTGLQESLLALALSRSGKKILHVDRNNYYGGGDAALSLQDAENWVEQLRLGVKESQFRNGSITRPPPIEDPEHDSKPSPSALSFSRAYSLALSPHLIYARSKLLNALVSARVDQQLEFLAVGNWWVYQGPAEGEQNGKLLQVPNGREDIFADQSLDLRSKRALVRFLRFLSNFESEPDTWTNRGAERFSSFLTSQFNLPTAVQQPLLALCLTSTSGQDLTTAFALPRVARHLRSIGVLGPAFGAVIPKWGGLAEVAQVGCRAGAVGGGVYTLGNAIESLSASPPASVESPVGDSHPEIEVHLQNGDKVRTTWIAGSSENIPASASTHSHPQNASAQDSSSAISRSISIVSAPMSNLFPPPPEGAPPSSAAVVYFPVSSLPAASDAHAIHIMVHSRDTGECPSGQSKLPAPTPH